MLRLNLSLLISLRHFLMKKSKDKNWPSGGVRLDFRIWSVSKVSLFEMLESSSLSWKKTFNWTQRRNFSTSCLTENSSVFLDMGTKFKLLLRTDFSESDSSKFSGMVTTVLRFSGDESLLIWGPISWSSFWALIWCKCLKSLELASWILARMDCTKTAGQITERTFRFEKATSRQRKIYMMKKAIMLHSHMSHRFANLSNNEQLL